MMAPSLCDLPKIFSAIVVAFLTTGRHNNVNGLLLNHPNTLQIRSSFGVSTMLWAKDSEIQKDGEMSSASSVAMGEGPDEGLNSGGAIDSATQQLSALSSTAPQTPPQKLQRQQSQSPSPQDLMMAMGTNPRRIAISLLSASGIALAGNFLGVTSKLLTAVPEETVEASGLDTYFPRGDYKRCRGKGYTFVIPKNWVADTFVELAKAQRNVKPLDYSMGSSKRRGGAGPTTLPDSAYGPAGRLVNGVSETGDTNVSVIVSSGLSGFTLPGTLGTPQDAAEKLLRLSIAPEGSGRIATLESAIEDKVRDAYEFEFVVDRGNPKLPPVRNLSVVAASPAGDKLYTLTVVSPVKSFENPKMAEQLRRIAKSFHLTL